MKNLFDELEVTVAGKNVQVVTHHGPHYDEIVAMVIAIIEGSEEWLKQYCPENILSLGVLGGPFDEHALPWRERQQECAATLVAKSLGVIKSPQWENVIRYARLNDTNGQTNPRGIAEVLNIYNNQNQNNIDAQVEACNWIHVATFIKYHDRENKDFSLDRIWQVAKSKPEILKNIGVNLRYVREWVDRSEEALQRYQALYLEARQEWRDLQAANRAVSKTVTINGRAVKICGAESDNYRMGAYLRSQTGEAAGVTIVKNRRGQVQICLQREGGLEAGELAAIIRIEERRRRGKGTMDWCRARMVGKIPEVPEWYYFLTKKFAMLMNGSLSYPFTDPTKIVFPELVGMVLAGINIKLFHPRHKELCRQGQCAGRACPWQAYGLARCRPKTNK